MGQSRLPRMNGSWDAYLASSPTWQRGEPGIEIIERTPLF